MGKSKRSIDLDDDVPKKRGRQNGAKTCKKPTLYKIINDCKPTNMLVWGAVAEQYRVQCGEMEAIPAATMNRSLVVSSSFRRCVKACVNLLDH